MGEKKVLYPNLLDDFGKDLIKALETLKRDSLKSALVSDIVNVLNSVFGIQQLLALSYNLNVANYEVLMKRLIELEKKFDAAEIELNKYKSEEAERLVKRISDNSIVREAIKNKT